MSKYFLLFCLSISLNNMIVAQTDQNTKLNYSEKSTPELIEKYSHKGKGYNPYLVGSKWQVAHLNFLPELAPDAIQKLDVHRKTDETFLLMAGQAVLIAGDIKDGDVAFEVINMKPKVLYNIPQDRWHNIAMSKDAEISITEDANTHKGDFDFFFLSEDQKKELKELIENKWEY